MSGGRRISERTARLSVSPHWRSSIATTSGRRSPSLASSSRTPRGAAANFLRVGHVHPPAGGTGHGLDPPQHREHPRQRTDVCCGKIAPTLVGRQVAQMAAQGVNHAVECLVRHRLGGQHRPASTTALSCSVSPDKNV